MSRRALGYSPAIPYLFLSPFLIVFMVFITYPLFYSVALATQQTYGPSNRVFVGIENFIYLFEDAKFRTAMWNTAVFTFGSLFIQLPCALGLALLLNRPDVKGRAIFRLIFFSPVMVGIVFMAVIAGLIFNAERGLLNIALEGALPGWPEDFRWLENYVMPALILASLWMYAGFNMIYFLAALQNVRKDLLEAATIDGANAWQRFLAVTLPAIRPVASFVVLLSLIGSVQLFELPWVLLGNSGGPNDQGLTIVMYLYQKGFEQNDLGYASAIGWALAIFLFTVALLQHWFAKRGEV